jgi:glycosyltransferase involved in cell wall biosynthesis
LHKKIARDIKRKNYDYIFVHPSKFTQAPFLLRFIKNCIYYCQEPLRIVYDSAVSSNISNISFPKNLYEFFNRKVRKWIDFRNISNASIILANSNYSKKFIEQSYNIKAEVCYLGVDINLFKPLNLSKIIDVLFIGNKDDGYMLLNKLSQFFDNNIKIKVVFRENGASLTDDELVKIYNQSKVMIALNYNEPFGLIPLETMACGTPVIAVDEGGYRESVINRKTGFLISRNSNELYDKIEIVINNEKIRKEMAKNARENILQNWTWDKSIAKFLKIIKYAK